MKRCRIEKLMLCGAILLTLGVGCLQDAGAARHKPDGVAAKTGRPTLPTPRTVEHQAGRSERVQAITKRAHRVFWKAFRHEDYARIGKVIHLLTAAYLSNPKNPETTLLLAHAYLWRVSERARGHAPRTQALSSLVVAQRFFEEANRLSPDDGRIIGWLGSVRLPLARIMRDKSLIARARATLHRAVKEYPRFNNFTAAYSFSNAPADSKQYARALRAMAETLSICPDQTVGKDGGTVISGGIKMTPKVKAACGNTTEAPHNLQGFLLIYGEMLAKTGKYDRAASMYEKAEASPGYASWPYKDLLGSRLKRAYDILDKPGAPERGAGDFPKIVGAKNSCGVCHATR